MQNIHNYQNDFAVVDLFCGIGGLTRGLIDEGLKVSAGIDFDDSCRYAYKENNNTEFLHKNVINLTAKELEECYPTGKRKILVGCAPCQPFSSHSYKIGTKKDIPTEDERWKLLYEFIRLIKETSPEIISMENVPQLRKHKVFQDFVGELVENGYHLSDYTKAVYCPDYGIPQKRYRLVLLASKLGPIELIKPTYQKKDYITVEDAIKKLPPLEHGTQLESDPLHRARKLTPLNLERIKAISEGQNWTYLDEKLISPCHKTERGKTFTVAYGRMRWKDQAPTITTHCIGFSNGNFGHPDQDRAISLREAALLQSFPANYKFIDNSSKLNIADLARHIGNAVPPKLGAAIGTSIIEHINSLANG